MDRARAKSRCHQYCDSKNRTASFHGLYSTPHLYVRDPSDSRASLGRDERKRRVPFREENTSPTARTRFVSLDRADAIIEGAPDVGFTSGSFFKGSTNSSSATHSIHSL